MGTILRIDLTSGKIQKEPLDYAIANQFIGGRGYGTKILFDEVPPHTDAFSEENKIVIMTGPLTGLAPASGRHSVISLSPMTGSVFHSEIGGHFGVELKRAGYDGIIIEGRAKAPVALVIKDDSIEITDAGTVWGASTSEAISQLKESGAKRAMTIGVAGENLVKFANIIDDSARAAGRGGLGAVMGSKNLKAIGVAGSKTIEPVNSYAFKQYYSKMLSTLKGHPITGDGLGRFGTLILVNPINKHGVLPVENFKYGFFEQAENISGETVSNYLVKKLACALCPIACGRTIKVGNQETHGPEYESAWALGPQCKNPDFETIVRANTLCNEFGLDTISMGNTIGFFMECSEKGLIKESIPFGDKDAILRLIEQTAQRDGIGADLAEGVKNASKKISGSSDFAIHVKGLELPAYDPRGVKGQSLAYVTNNRGGCHLGAYMIPGEVLSLPDYLNNMETRNKAGMVHRLEDVFAMLDSLCVCAFTTFAVFETFNYEAAIFAKLLTTATGFYFDESSFRKAGERIWNLERCFNIREGLTAKDDALPKRFTEPMPSGPAKDAVESIDAMLGEYYKLRGWSAEGVPEEKKLQELDLDIIEAWPKLQVALDLRSLDDALDLAKSAVAGGADWIEVGTPLIKSAGMNAVSTMRKNFPNKVIVADLKTMDTGMLETEMAAQAGADIIGIAGAAGDHTLMDAVGAAKKYGVKIMADLISIKDPVKRAQELEAMGVDFLEFHISVDEQMRSGNAKIPFPLVSDVVKAVSIPVAVAGGMRADTAPLAIKSGAKVVVVGGSITRAASAEQASRVILKAIGR